MKKLFLTGIAALFLATGAAHAAEDTRKWVWRCSFPHTQQSGQPDALEIGMGAIALLLLLAIVRFAESGHGWAIYE